MIPKNELLALLDKTEQERALWLKDKGILSYRCRATAIDETLADLAERLWKRALHVNLDFAMRIVADKLAVDFDRFWKMYYKSIHRIDAAIIALQRAGVDVTKESVE